MPRSYDYVVVGAGAAGCVVAARLSEDPSVRVLFLEAGGRDRHPLLRIPALAVFATLLPQHNWDFITEPIAALNDRRLRWSQGRGIGGSSSVNGMLYMRGNSREYDAWAQAGCDGWSFDGVLPFFKKAEANERGESAWHGGSGPMNVKRSNPRLPICDAFLAAAQEAGFPVVSDLSADPVEGFGYFDVNIARGRRQSAASAYLKPAKQRPNLTVMPDALVHRVAIEGNRAAGVQLASAGGLETIRCEREVVVCGGALNSPGIFMHSGIGPAEHLRAHGIAVVHDAPQVGANLQNHPAYALRYACSKPITAYRHLQPLRAVQAGIEYALWGGGPLGESYVATGGFFKTDPSQAVSDVIVVMAPGLIRRAEMGAKVWDILPNQHGFQVTVAVGRPKTKGEIRLRSADPADHPLISPRYFDEPDDMRTLVRGVQRLREMMRAPSMREVVSEELQPGPERLDDKAVEDDIRARSVNYYHPSGTCRMGGDAQSVVDPQLRVRGVEGLRVADASVMPAPLCACTHAPAIMIGEKAAELIRT